MRTRGQSRVGVNTDGTIHSCEGTREAAWKKAAAARERKRKREELRLDPAEAEFKAEIEDMLSREFLSLPKGELNPGLRAEHGGPVECHLARLAGFWCTFQPLCALFFRPPRKRLDTR